MVAAATLTRGLPWCPSKRESKVTLATASSHGGAEIAANGKASDAATRLAISSSFTLAIHVQTSTRINMLCQER
jgi:hypothetical protein